MHLAGTARQLRERGNSPKRIPQYSHAPTSAVYLRGEPRHDEKLYRDIMWDICTPGVSLAEIYLDDVWVEGDFQTEYATLFYVTTRDRLAARDFDKVQRSMDFLG